MPLPKLRRSVIEAAIVGFEQQKIQIDSQISELRAMLAGSPAESAATSETRTPKRRKMSAAARRRIGDAQRARWAASKKAAGASAPKATPKPKRKISAAGLKAIREATKKRWAAYRKAKKAAA
jgi:hypothetical protein